LTYVRATVAMLWGYTNVRGLGPIVLAIIHLRIAGRRWTALHNFWSEKWASWKPPCLP